MADARETLVHAEERDGALIVTVAADQLNAIRVLDQFDGQLQALLQRYPQRRWVLDFRGVAFMVTPAVNTLLVVMKRLRTAGGDLVLTGLSPSIRHIFELMRLDQVLTIYPGTDAALAALKAGRPDDARGSA